MRIQTRLFLGTALLVLALMATQWWLHLRQLRAMEAELGAVAASVGKDILKFGPDTLMRDFNQVTHGMVWVDGEGNDGAEIERQFRREVHVVVIPEGSDVDMTGRVTSQVIRTLPEVGPHVEVDGIQVRTERIEMEIDGSAVADDEAFGDGETLRYVLQVVADEEGAERTLLIKGDGGQLHRIPIPVEPAVQTFRSTMQRGAAMGGAL